MSDVRFFGGFNGAVLGKHFIPLPVGRAGLGSFQADILFLPVAMRTLKASPSRSSRGRLKLFLGDSVDLVTRLGLRSLVSRCDIWRFTLGLSLGGRSIIGFTYLRRPA
jgi:hypothetical protein